MRRFRYSESGDCGYITDTINDSILLRGTCMESRKFLKMATRLINDKFIECELNCEISPPTGEDFKKAYKNILEEDLFYD